MSKQKMDRYGWYQTHGDRTPAEIKADLEDEKTESRREIEWINIINNYPTIIKSKRNHIAECVKAGIPETIRGTAWYTILNAKEYENISYTALLEDVRELMRTEDEKNIPSAFAVIKRDLHRSFPQVGLFAEESFLEKLKNVLFAYAQYDQELGYTQGMNFLAGMLLCYMEEEQSFHSLVAILKGPRTMHRDYFTSGFPRLSIADNMFEQIMHKKYPYLLKHMEEFGLVSSMFTSSYFMTAFMNFSWNPELQMRIFERFLFYGTRGLLGFATAIVSRHKAQIKGATDISDILSPLQQPDESPNTSDWRYLLKKWDEHWVKKSDYLRLLKNAGGEPEPML